MKLANNRIEWRLYLAALLTVAIANVLAENKVRCMEAGMSDFLGKPFDSATLFSTLLRSLTQAADGTGPKPEGKPT